MAQRFDLYLANDRGQCCHLQASNVSFAVAQAFLDAGGDGTHRPLALCGHYNVRRPTEADPHFTCRDCDAYVY